MGGGRPNKGKHSLFAICQKGALRWDRSLGCAGVVCCHFDANRTIVLKLTSSGLSVDFSGTSNRIFLPSRIVIMKIYYFAVLALILAERAVGFIPMQHQQRPALHHARRALSAASMADTDTDVSIPYDAAARLAYDEWRAEYKKGDFDAARYETFKNNYETITVANVAAKKKARDDGTVSLSLMTLNEFGDMSEDEYMQKQRASGKIEFTSTGDVLSKAVENAELQNVASNALGEAADALAEEEQVSRQTAVLGWFHFLYFLLFRWSCR